MAYTVEWGSIRTRFGGDAAPSPPLQVHVAPGGEPEALAEAERYLRLGFLVLSIKDHSGKEIMDFDEVWRAVFRPEGYAETRVL